MSLLERLGRGHLSDATLARLWTDEHEIGSAPHPHLDACAPCRARYDALARWIDGVGDTLRDEADALLKPERLGAQQAQIVRRLEAIDRPARVLAFPNAARAVISGHSHRPSIEMRDGILYLNPGSAGPRRFNELRGDVAGISGKVLSARLRRLSPCPSLQTTELIDDAFMRLVSHRGVDWEGRGEFFRVAHGVIRRILCDQVRSSIQRRRSSLNSTRA